MVDSLLKEAEEQYRRARQDHASGALHGALVAYQAALERLLRWAMIRDGADADRATDPAEVTWQDLVIFLDARHGVDREACIFLSQVTHVCDQITSGARPEVSTLLLESYGTLVTQLFRRFFPRSAEERQEVATRATFARRRPVADLTAMPPARAYDTQIKVPAHAPPPRSGAADDAASDAAAAAETLPPGDAPLHTGPEWPPAGSPSEQVPVTAGLRQPSAPADLTPEARAIAAGQRLRAMQAAGLEFCPHCREVVAQTAPRCPHCHYDVEYHRTTRDPARPAARGGILDRLLGRRR
ncbi:MAG TPA: hypothetical protein VM536_06615 [Chloroflexia bacterium]|nr:hypothetical protein [Chloroflexia bacterium]